MNRTATFVASRSRPSRLRPLWTGLALLSLAGCGGGSKGPTLAPVVGTVTLDGKPLAHARVVFQPTGPNASPSVGETDDSGSFELAFNRRSKGALPGSHTVRVTTAGVISDLSGKETVVEEAVPPQYNQKSELKYDVKAEPNRFEIALESKRAPKKS